MAGLITGWVFDGNGGGTEIHAAGDIPDSDRSDIVWLHLFIDGEDSRELAEMAAPTMPVGVLDALFAPDTRPRCETFQQGVLLNLRGVNLNAGAELEDLISVRAWIAGTRIVSVRRHRLMSADDIRRRLSDADEVGPRTPGDFALQLADGLCSRLEALIEDLNDRIDAMEEATSPDGEQRSHLLEMRRVVATLRRFIAPQQSALSRLAIVDVPWLSERERTALRHLVDDVTRYLEDLEAIRERAGILADAAAHRAAENANRTMYLLTVVATLFLPLGFLTGLLGINVGGIPGTENPLAFWIVATTLAGLGGLEWLVLRRLKVI